jgi:DNA-binding MarR family transcriptional regulator
VSETVRHLPIKDLPRYECLLEAATEFPDLDPSATEAFLHLLRTGDEVARVVQSQLRNHEVSPGRFGVLMALWGKCQRAKHHEEETSPCLTPAELADRSGVTRATMTGLIDTLVRDGLVRRDPHPDDRRMMSVQLTERGTALVRAILPNHFREMAWLLQPLSESERQTLVRLLSKIQQRAAERPSVPADDPVSVPN